MLTVWLEYQRSTLLWKCEGLDGAALARQVLPPSSLTLLGLVRHMAIVEWWWFDHILTGSSSPEPISTTDDRDADFNDLDPVRATDDLALFQRQCEVSRAIASAAPSLDVTSTSTEKPTVSLRWVMIHMIEEYARHNGHADLLREQIDGVVGE
jgi:uncharacterized damage-inducible protein DinB